MAKHKSTFGNISGFGATKLTRLQQRALDAYQTATRMQIFSGDDVPTLEEIQRNVHGDGLLTFIITELGDAATAEEARRMLKRAADQLLEVADDLE